MKNTITKQYNLDKQTKPLTELTLVPKTDDVYTGTAVFSIDDPAVDVWMLNVLR